ncbi:VWA domain-containing protein [Endothiovibrio diazotrophicus]
MFDQIRSLSKRLLAVAALALPLGAWAAPSVVIDDPLDSATVDADHVLVQGTASAVGGGQGIDLMLVLDDSGSLFVSDPTRERFEAVRQLMNSFGPQVNVHVGMVFFHSSASLDVSLGEVATVSGSVEQALLSHASPGGHTAIGEGIAKAADELSANGRANASHVIVVFTDGANDTGTSPVDAATSAAAHAVVNVVGLGSGSSYQSDMQEIATAGGGVYLNASAPADLIALFRDARVVGIEEVTVRNETTGESAALVNVVSGTFSASLDLAEGSNTLAVTATDTEGVTGTTSVTVTRPAAITTTPVADRRVKLRPQVLMAGFDPMLVDITDTSFDILAVVRQGATPISSVSLSENTGGLANGMTLRGSLTNGDGVYGATYTFARGSFASGTELANLFGSGSGEYNITVTDQGQLTHSFPSLEYGNNPDVTASSSASSGSAYTTRGPSRLKPQVLLVGFDPALLDYDDSQFDVKAIVRAGATALQNVTLKNGGSFAMGMTAEGDIGNGDQMYKTTFTFPRGSFPAGSFRDLFGTAQESEFVVEVTDQGQQTHRFPALEVGNYPEL